jgi:ubiquitin-protein ligase
MTEEHFWGIEIFPDVNDTINLKAAIASPIDSSYEGGKFHLKFDS